MEAAPSYQLEGLEPVYAGGTFQNGGVAPPTRPNPAGVLDDKIVPERCLSPDSNPQGSPVPPPILLGGQNLQLPVSPIWPVTSTKSVYNACKMSGGPSETDGTMPHNLLSQYAIQACKQGTVVGHDTTDSKHFQSFGSYSE